MYPIKTLKSETENANQERPISKSSQKPAMLTTSKEPEIKISEAYLKAMYRAPAYS